MPKNFHLPRRECSKIQALYKQAYCSKFRSIVITARLIRRWVFLRKSPEISWVDEQMSKKRAIPLIFPRFFHLRLAKRSEMWFLTRPRVRLTFF
jgi:hypothetical protein